MNESEKFEPNQPLKIKPHHFIIGMGVFLLVFNTMIKIINLLIDSFIYFFQT